MTKQVLFSVVVPAKNEAAHIGRLMKSVFDSPGAGVRIECLVIDNGSDDATVEIARRAGARVEIRPDLNLSEMRNLGADLATGDYIAFLDADMEMPEGWATYSLGLLQHAGFDMIALSTGLPDGAPRLWKMWAERTNAPGVRVKDSFPAQNMMTKRHVFLSVGGFNPTLKTAEDSELCLRYVAKGYKCAKSGELKAVHHGGDASFKVFMKKECWRTARALEVAALQGYRFRALRFPVSGLFVFWGTLVAVVALFFAPFVSLIVGLGIGGLYAVYVFWKVAHRTSLKERCLLGCLAMLQLFFAGYSISLNTIKKAVLFPRFRLKRKTSKVL